MNTETQIRRLPPSNKKDLYQILDYNESWKNILGIIPRRLRKNEYECRVSSANPYKYNSQHVQIIEGESFNKKVSCSEIFLREWSTTGPVLPTLGHFLNLLVQAELLRAADYVSVNILGGGPVPRPEDGPAAEVIVDLPKQRRQIDQMLDGVNYPSSLLSDLATNNQNVNIDNAKPKLVIPKIVIISDSENESNSTPPLVRNKQIVRHEPVDNVNLPSNMIQFSESEVQGKFDSSISANKNAKSVVSDMMEFSQSQVLSEDGPLPNITDLISPESQRNVQYSSPALEMLLNRSEVINESSQLSNESLTSTDSGSQPNLSILNGNHQSELLPSIGALIGNSEPIETNNVPNFDALMTSTTQNALKSGSSGALHKTLSGSLGISVVSYVPQSQRSTHTKCSSPLPNLSLNTILPHFTYEEIEAVTNNFDQTPCKNCTEVENDLDVSNSRFLGSGAFGSVFLGLGIAEKPIAVKKLFLSNPDVVNVDDIVTIQFKNEVEILCKYKHENLLSLLEYSCDGLTYCSFYEFVPGGSLADRLQNTANKLIWTDRLYIALGIAKAVSYLHTAYSTPLIHRDIKTANILLNCSNKPKLCDFGLMKLLPNQNANTLTTIFGTTCYMAPEAFHSEVSVKLDTFSFGVVLLELITGLPPMDNDREGGDIVTYVKETVRDCITPVVDTKAGTWISNGINYSEELDKIAQNCLEDSYTKRPAMVEVLEDLKQLIMDLYLCNYTPRYYYRYSFAILYCLLKLGCDLISRIFF